MRAKKYIVTLMTIWLGLVPFLSTIHVYPTQAQSDQTLQIDGLQASVTVIYDQMGFPHIYAENMHDLFMAQGFVEASHRWWQMEWWRHLSAGRLSEIAGESALDTDIYNRTLDFTSASERDWEILSDDSKAMLQAYSGGVNAYLQGKSPADAAIEYQWLALGGVNIELEAWTVNDSIRWLKVMAAGLSENMNVELARTQLIEVVGPLATQLLVPPYPFNEHPIITEPGGIDYADTDLSDTSLIIPENVDYSAISTTLVAGLDLDNVYSPFGSGEGIGSNSWVIGGELTDSGLPYLANDPHLGIQMPSIWYEIGLHCTVVSDECPFDVVGVTLPSVPAVVIGHNRNIAWGFTNVGADVQDLFILTINPDNPLQYMLDDEWVDFDVVTETIVVHGGESVDLQVLNSVWGPVISDAIDVEDQVLALRWTALDASTSLDASFALNQASNWDEFRVAMSLFDVPSQNVIYADIEGNIGYQMPGNIPIRVDGHDGKVPFDGSRSDNAWQGFVPFDELPTIFNPEAGYIVTANNVVTGPDYPYHLTDVTSYGWRAVRIETLIQNDPDGVITMDDMAAIHGDNYNLKADFLIPALQNLETNDEIILNAVDWLADWDRQNHMDSPQAALFETFWVELLTLAFVDDMGTILAGGADWEWYLMSQLVQMSQSPVWDSQLTPDVTESRDDILSQAITQAWDRMTEAQGDDPGQWSWGGLHYAKFTALPLGTGGIDPAIDPILDSLFNVTVPASGGNSIVNATGWNANRPFAVTALPSMRQVLNVADWDASWRVNTLGQSGDPRSRHYRDQVELWRHIEYHPEWFTRDAVEADSEATWILVPAE